MSLNTYLTFGSNCREVFEFYRSVFGGEFANVVTFREGPPDMGIPEEELDRIMHVTLPIGSSALMGSDSSSAFGPPPVAGNNFYISFTAETREEADARFAKLSEGGEVEMEMQDMFWGAYFGSLKDKFGIKWQVSHGDAG
jgi:PhnB protein